jgi:hypothetical protein
MRIPAHFLFVLDILRLEEGYRCEVGMDSYQRARKIKKLDEMSDQEKNVLSIDLSSKFFEGILNRLRKNGFCGISIRG